MFTIIPLISTLVIGTTAVAQVGGGSAAFNQGNRSGAQEALAHELAKRNVPFGEGRFVDAAVLMNVKPDEYVAVFGISLERRCGQQKAGHGIQHALRVTFWPEFGGPELEPKWPV